MLALPHLFEHLLEVFFLLFGVVTLHMCDLCEVGCPVLVLVEIPHLLLHLLIVGDAMLLSVVVFVVDLLVVKCPKVVFVFENLFGSGPLRLFVCFVGPFEI